MWAANRSRTPAFVCISIPVLLNPAQSRCVGMMFGSCGFDQTFIEAQSGAHRWLWKCTLNFLAWMASRQSSPLLKREDLWDLWGFVAIFCYSQNSKYSLYAFPAGGNGMDSVTKKTRQDGSEVTERRKENIFHFLITRLNCSPKIPQPDFQFYKRFNADQISRPKSARVLGISAKVRKKE